MISKCSRWNLSPAEFAGKSDHGSRRKIGNAPTASSIAMGAIWNDSVPTLRTCELTRCGGRDHRKSRCQPGRDYGTIAKVLCPQGLFGEYHEIAYAPKTTPLSPVFRRMGRSHPLNVGTEVQTMRRRLTMLIKWCVSIAALSLCVWIVCYCTRLCRERSVVEMVEAAGGIATRNVEMSFIPTAISRRTTFFDRVDSVDLTNTRFGDEDIGQLIAFAEMQTVSLSGTSVGDTGLCRLTELGKLVDMDLSQTRISDSGLECLGRLPQLRMLNLSRTRVRGVGFTGFRDVTRLRGLNLEGTRMESAAFPIIGRFHSLNELVLDNSGVTDDDMAALRGLTHLKRLFLSETMVTWRGIGHLSSATELEELRLAGTSADDHLMRVLGVFKKLQVLDLSNTFVTDHGLKALMQLEHLRWVLLNVTKTSKEGRESLRRALKCRVLPEP